MIIVDVEQRSFEWLEARQGIPTASQLPRLLTEKTQKYSVVGARKYRNELLAEWLLDASLDGGNTLWMDRGTMLETEARQYYELLRMSSSTRLGSSSATIAASGDRPMRW